MTDIEGEGVASVAPAVAHLPRWTPATSAFTAPQMTDSPSNAKRLQYFRSLFDESLTLIEAFPITTEPALMSYVTDVLEPVAAAQRMTPPFTNPGAEVIAEGRRWLANVRPEDQRSVGLNTVGLLLDRLSILTVKYWNLVHRRKTPHEAEALLDTQVIELIRALSWALPGESSVNNKMTNRVVTTESPDFRISYYGLATTNLLLWEAQEILYNHDISSLPCEELRAYIDFFSRGNLERNAYIHSSDTQFWSSMIETASAA
ncbi:hypothetical protein [Caulobacter sp. S45]|uniref:hypothetical protein n=1 Tax=Caulobacter sp. S45 TaxID=1641861 RepID=UPI001575B265|nr:hypothetical protein [Caulobacter sp. S45]